MRKIVYLALGSNIGDKEAHLNTAIDALQKHEQINIIKQSDFLTTKAVGVNDDQDDYLNAAISIETALSARELFDLTRQIEKDCGRNTKGDYKARTLDIDILFYDEHIINEDDLIIPHPRLAERMFVLHPLMQVNPDFIHPVLKRTVRELYNNLL